ncbi:MAG: Gx transporter family protein [Clostridia bacterium]|jgi:heptaprenyl diphosphate synthase
MNRIRKLVLMGLFISMALILHYIEGFFPVLIPGVPGAKLGLANIFTLVTLVVFGWKEAFIVVVVRSILGPLLGGAPTGILYSMAGGVLSAAVMAAVYRILGNRVSLFGVSIAGAVFHNIGQLLVAALVFSNFYLFTYLPIMTIIALPTGFFVGLTARHIIIYIGNMVQKA